IALIRRDHFRGGRENIVGVLRERQEALVIRRVLFRIKYNCDATIAKERDDLFEKSTLQMTFSTKACPRPIIDTTPSGHYQQDIYVYVLAIIICQNRPEIGKTVKTLI